MMRARFLKEQGMAKMHQYGAFFVGPAAARLARLLLSQQALHFLIGEQ
jgi:hypothetical protein